MSSTVRYELSEGSSNKFWEIALSDKSFTTKYGRIGANGQTTIKSFGSSAEAKIQYDKLIAEKVKKGYQPVGAATSGTSKRNGKAATNGKAKVATNGKAAKATGASASGKPGARYFELVDGSSSKFWEVWVEGSALSTRYGKIGAGGQQTVKKLKSAAEAAKEMAKLIGDKTRKGYVEGGAAGGATTTSSITGTADARNPDLEKAIAANPSDRDAYAVFADWLMEQGDPRGELISLQLGNKEKQAQKLIEKHADYFLGPLVEHQKVHDEGYNNSRSHLRTPAQEAEWQKTQKQAFLWRNGFIHRVRLSHDSYSDSEWKGNTVDVLDQVLRHPSGRYVVEFAFQSNGDPNENDLQDLIDLLGKKAPPTTRKITFGDNVDQISWHHTGDLGKLWKGVPNLRVLEIESGEFDVGKMVAPALERAIFLTGGLSKACGKHIAAAAMPKIKHLEIYYGSDNYGGHCSVKEVRPLLDRGDLKHLEYLGLKNSMFADDIAKALPGAKVLKTLKTLDLSLGMMTDAGAAALAAAKDSLAHLECLDVHRNFLSKKGVAAIKGICKKVISSEQETADDWGDGELHYYVSISE